MPHIRFHRSALLATVARVTAGARSIEHDLSGVFSCGIEQLVAGGGASSELLDLGERDCKPELASCLGWLRLLDLLMASMMLRAYMFRCGSRSSKIS